MQEALEIGETWGRATDQPVLGLHPEFQSQRLAVREDDVLEQQVLRVRTVRLLWATGSAEVRGWSYLYVPAR